MRGNHFNYMKQATISIDAARSTFPALIRKVRSGATVTITQRGQPVAALVPVAGQGHPWRVTKPDDPARYGDLQTPILEDWE